MPARARRLERGLAMPSNASVYSITPGTQPGIPTLEALARTAETAIRKARRCRR
jgi:hypothetical protein